MSFAQSLGLESHKVRKGLAEASLPYEDEYDPESPEPRFLQLAKAEIQRRKDLRCGDCGFLGLPSPDQKCPNCGGSMESPDVGFDSPTMTADEIRSAIRQQWNTRQQAETRRLQSPGEALAEDEIDLE